LYLKLTFSKATALIAILGKIMPCRLSFFSGRAKKLLTLLKEEEYSPYSQKHLNTSRKFSKIIHIGNKLLLATESTPIKSSKR